MADTLKLEVGKFYRTRDGRKVGPMEPGPAADLMWVAPDNMTARFLNGRVVRDGESPADLIAEWCDGPVRTVTRKEIVGGVYGRLYIDRQAGGDGRRILIDLANINGERKDGAVSQGWSYDELRAAIATLTEIADALDEQAGAS
jgi:hypothetical protein